ncbi:MAG TPA: aromatic ring-hydroxylating dioxygenase subunit alpha [Kineosporiaceae bacterium]|nr:aromatic ring-hydroxylating dioxygenase subunit alpha [Kineosporiaceae bacterium]
MSVFARNQWYVAAYGSEVGREILGRTILGESIVLYRSTEGSVVALTGRCVHRRFPLAQSPTRLVDDTIVCGYHGFTYDSSGSCVYVPAQKRIPRTARLGVYPVVEQDNFVWVWIGDNDKADATTIPRAPYLADSSYTLVKGMEVLDARYGLLVDNLMDLSHETYLHGGYIGTPEVAETPIQTEVDEDARIVRVSRRMTDVACPPFYRESTGIQGNIDRWQDIEYYAPCLYKLHSRIAPTGVPVRADGTDPDACHAEIVYAITPSTENSTYDFWMVARDFAVGDDKVSQYLAESNRAVVMQDVVALNVLERAIASEPAGYQELSVNIDTGGLAARRLLAKLAAEGSQQPDSAVPAAVVRP